MTSMTAKAAGALASIEDLCGEGLTAQELLEETSTRIARVIPADGLFFSATDPDTTLCMGSGFVVGLPEESCQPLWDHEFHVPDYNKFAELAEGPVRVADLHTATGGRPQRSARWRSFYALTGLESEVRVAFTAGGAAWGVGQFNRSAELPGFDASDLAFLAEAAPVIGAGLRSAVLSETAAPTGGRGPGIVVLDEDGELVSATAEAEAWLAEVDSTLHVPNEFGTPLPIEAHIYATAARDGSGNGSVPARARLRTRDGRWLILHASALRGERASGEVALMIEPASAGDVAEVIVRAYGMTPRELEVTQLVARGLRTAEIAERLFLSAHTVRDHIKSIFEKVGVSSRGELVSRLFAEHFHDSLADAVAEAEARLEPVAFGA